MYNFIFIVLAIIHFSSYTSASWLIPPYDVPSPTPDPNETRSCADWLKYYYFVDDVTKNRTMAHDRAKQFDNDVSDLAVMYVHLLVAFPHLEIDPAMHCSMYYRHFIPSPFLSFKLLLQTCYGWIHQYRYELDDRNNVNWLHAKSRDSNEDENISAWAATYARFIDGEKHPISVTNFCRGMGFSNEHYMSFISFNETTKTCKEWIHLSEYEDNMNDNIIKSRTQDLSYMNFLNVRTRLYIEYLHTYLPKTNIFGQISTAVHNIPWTPTEFCDQKGWTDDVLFKYFGDEPLSIN